MYMYIHAYVCMDIHVSVFTLGHARGLEPRLRGYVSVLSLIMIIQSYQAFFLSTGSSR